MLFFDIIKLFAGTLSLPNEFYASNFDGFKEKLAMSYDLQIYFDNFFKFWA